MDANFKYIYIFKISRTPGVPSRTPRGTRTPIWEPLIYVML